MVAPLSASADRAISYGYRCSWRWRPGIKPPENAMVKRQTIALLAAGGTGSAGINRQAAGAGGRGSEQDATSGTQSRIACRQTAREGRGGVRTALRRLTGTGRTRGESDATVKSGFTERSSIRLTVRSFMMPMAMVLAISRAFAKSYTTFAASERRCSG